MKPKQTLEAFLVGYARDELNLIARPVTHKVSRPPGTLRRTSKTEQNVPLPRISPASRLEGLMRRELPERVDMLRLLAAVVSTNGFVLRWALAAV